MTMVPIVMFVSPRATLPELMFRVVIVGPPLMGHTIPFAVTLALIVPNVSAEFPTIALVAVRAATLVVSDPMLAVSPVTLVKSQVEKPFPAKLNVAVPVLRVRVAVPVTENF